MPCCRDVILPRHPCFPLQQSSRGHAVSASTSCPATSTLLRAACGSPAGTLLTHGLARNQSHHRRLALDSQSLDWQRMWLPKIDCVRCCEPRRQPMSNWTSLVRMEKAAAASGWKGKRLNGKHNKNCQLWEEGRWHDITGRRRKWEDKMWHQMRWHEVTLNKMRWVDNGWDEARWDEMRWDQMTWNKGQPMKKDGKDPTFKRHGTGMTSQEIVAVKHRRLRCHL